MKRFTFLLCLLVAAGCASKPESAPDSLFDPAAKALEESAVRVARAAEQAALAQSVTGTSRVTQEYSIDLAALPPELSTPILLEGGFNGELELFLDSLCTVIGWGKPITLGMKPATPLLVTFTEQRRPPVYWAADAGYQAGSLADVTINTELKQVVISYKEAGYPR